VLWIVVPIAVLVLLVLVVGWLLPVGHEASRSISVGRSPQDVYAVIADVETYPKWWSDMVRVEMLPAQEGRIRFRQHMSSGPVVVEIVETSAPTKFVTRIADPDQPFGGTWTWEIAPAGSGSTITITERGEVYSPLFRFMSRFVFGHTATLDSCLTALRARLTA
jgi:uncharacterized protein YndB with AHSA1/START domain